MGLALKVLKNNQLFRANPFITASFSNLRLIKT